MFLLHTLTGRVTVWNPCVRLLAVLVVSLVAQSCTSLATVSRANIPYAEPDPTVVKVAPPSGARMQNVSLSTNRKPASKHALRGHASWYGPGFHGKKTASGEIYDQTKLTAAHKTLPLGSKAKVTNLENGNTVEVQINDRGPFIEGRIIDMSQAAAGALGFVEAGIAPVRVEMVEATAPQW
jgi:rare lipoprotein A (peptidoglycan hydrolase)